MEEIIKELENHLDTLKDKENLEIYNLINSEVLNRTFGEIKNRVIMSEQAGNKDPQKITDSIYTSLIENPEAFLGITETERNQMIARCEEKVKINNYERSYIIHLLSGFIDYMHLTEPQAFLELDKLAEIFKYINLHINSQIKIFTYIVHINHTLDKNPEEETFVPDVNALVEYNYKYMDPDELRAILSEHRFDAFMDDENYPNKRGQEEVKKRYEETKLDFSSRQQACNNLDVLFSREPEDLTEEDYQAIIDNMNEVFFDSIAHRVVKILKKQKDKSLETAQLEENTVEEQNPQDDNSKTIPKIKQRKINQVYYEIGKLYDLENFKVKQTLSLDEIIYILSLMHSINIREDVIEKFLSSVMHHYQKGHPFVIYYESLQKFASFSTNPEIKEHLDMLEYILSDFSIFMCPIEKYIEIKKMVEEEIREINNLIGSDYSYEREQAKKKLMPNEE